MLDADTKSRVRARLRRAEGQLQGIERMIDEDRYCVDILMQLAAARAALAKTAEVILEKHVETCVSHALASGHAEDRKQKIDELIEVFGKFGAR